MLDAAGFERLDEQDWRLDIDMASWLARMRTPPILELAARRLFAHAPVEVARYYVVDPDTLDFSLESAMFTARLAG